MTYIIILFFVFLHEMDCNNNDREILTCIMLDSFLAGIFGHHCPEVIVKAGKPLVDECPEQSRYKREVSKNSEDNSEDQLSTFLQSGRDEVVSVSIIKNQEFLTFHSKPCSAYQCPLTERNSHED